MNKKVFIEGMTCGHCKMHVENALNEINGVKSVTVNLKEKVANIELAKAVDDVQLIAAVEDIGYSVAKIED